MGEIFLYLTLLPILFVYFFYLLPYNGFLEKGIPVKGDTYFSTS